LPLHRKANNAGCGVLPDMAVGTLPQCTFNATSYNHSSMTISLNELRPAEPNQFRIAFWLFIALNCLFLITSTGRARTMDEVMTYFTTQSLAQHGTTVVPQAPRAGLFYGKFDVHGEARAAYPLGQALMASPWYLAGERVIMKLPGVPSDAHDPVMAFAVDCSSATFTAACGAMLYLVFLSFGLNNPLSIKATLAVIFGTQLFAYSGWFYSEPLTTLLLLSAAFALFTKDESKSASYLQLLVAGLFLGATVWVLPTQVVMAGIFLIALYLREARIGEREAAIKTATLGYVIGMFVLAYLVNNKRLFGSPFDFGYPSTAEFGRHLNGFTTPLLTGLSGFLFSPGKSILLFAPVIIPALLLMPRFWRSNRSWAILAAGLPLCSLLLYSKYAQWEGGYCFGPRYFVPSLAFLAIAITPVFKETNAKMLRWTMVASLIGLTINLIGLSTNYLEDQAIRGVYYDANWNYVWLHSPISAQAALFMKHLFSGTPAPIGLGFDRWFLFLHKAGVSGYVISGIAVIPLAGLCWSVGKLSKVMRTTV
jgi:hypothetical protein